MSLTAKFINERVATKLNKTVAQRGESFHLTALGGGGFHHLTGVPVWVNADPTRLEQMVNTLLVNAFKFTPPGGLVEVTVRACAQEAVLTVKDSGMGILPELLAHVFEMFVQESASLDRAQGGLGIELTLKRQLASLHGGTVSADSAGPGQGRAPSWSACRALQRPLRSLLDTEGHEVLEAATGTAGQLACQEKPDLAIMDIGLPEMTGYEVAEHLRANADTRIVMTGYGHQEDRKYALAAEFDVRRHSLAVQCSSLFKFGAVVF